MASDDLKLALLDPPEKGDLEEGVDGDGATPPATTTTKQNMLPSWLQPLEERWKAHVVRWGPQIDFTVRLMIVSSFIDDSIRTVMHFGDLSNQVFNSGIVYDLLFWLPKDLVLLVVSLALLLGLLAQATGSMGVLRLQRTDLSTKMLLGWTLFQPFLYGQVLSNAEFFAGSISLAGALLILRSHLVDSSGGARNQKLGRHLLPVVWLYYTGTFFTKAIGYEETTSMVAYLLSVTRFVGCLVLLGLLVMGSSLVANGLRSRLVALFLAVTNLGLVCYRHPFFRYLSYENGTWTVVGPIFKNLPSAYANQKATLEAHPWEVWGLHKYYFLIGLSTSGALLLLAQHGSGESAVRNKQARTVE